jgi:AcrR family transcriptional regulator
MVEDRRVRRTRRVLRAALLALIAERGYDRVSVQDILDRADLARATFYAHFHDKDDLLLNGWKELEQALREAMAAYVASPHADPADNIGTARALFEHVAEHRVLYRGLVGSRAGPIVLKEVRGRFTALTREHLQDMIASRHSAPTVPVQAMAEFVVGALLGTLTWWLENEAPYSAQQIAEMVIRLTVPALEVGLGLRPASHQAGMGIGFRPV